MTCAERARGRGLPCTDHAVPCLNALMSDGRLPARRRWVGWVIGLAVVIVLLATAWVLVRGFGAASELQSVRNSVVQLRSAIADRELERAERIAPRIIQHAALAHDLTSDAVWRGFEVLPWLGANFTALREVAEITDEVATDAVMRSLLDTAQIVNPATLGFTGSRIDLGPLSGVRSSLEPASAALDAANTRALRIDAGSALPPVADAVRDAQALVREAATTIGAMHGASALLPSMLGGGEARTHLVVLQDNSEIRSHGGAIAAVSLVRTENGAISILRTISAQDLSALDTPLPLDEATRALFGDAAGRSVRDATSIPDFASAAAVVAERWQQQYGDIISGVVAIDLIAGAYLTDVPGSVSFGSFTADADTFVPTLITDLPAAAPDPVQQDAVLAEASAAVLSASLAAGEPSALLGAIAEAAADDRIRVWSSSPDEQQRLAASTLGGTLPVDDEHDVHVGVLLNDATGSPLGSHAHATISTATGVCHGEPTTQISVTWISEVSDEAAASSTASSDLEAGDIRTLIAVYGPEGTTISDGEAVAMLGTRPVAQHDLTLSPGESATVTTTFTGTGAGDRSTHLHHTPLLDDPDVVRADVDCG